MKKQCIVKICQFLVAFILPLLVIYVGVPYVIAIYNGELKEWHEFVNTLILAIPIAFITWRLGKDSEKSADSMQKIEKQNLFLRMEEKYIQELEAWAQEMIIVTGNPERHLIDPTTNQIVKEWSMPSDIKVNQDHVGAGIKQAYSRHMVTRHGKDYDSAPPFSEIRIALPKAAVRLARAIEKYITLYEALLEISHKFQEDLGVKGEYLFNYKNFFVGMLYEELTARDAYGKNATVKSVTEKLQSPLLKH